MTGSDFHTIISVICLHCSSSSSSSSSLKCFVRLPPSHRRCFIEMCLILRNIFRAWNVFPKKPAFELPTKMKRGIRPNKRSMISQLETEISVTDVGQDCQTMLSSFFIGNNLSIFSPFGKQPQESWQYKLFFPSTQSQERNILLKFRFRNWFAEERKVKAYIKVIAKLISSCGAFIARATVMNFRRLISIPMRRSYPRAQVINPSFWKSLSA